MEQSETEWSCSVKGCLRPGTEMLEVDGVEVCPVCPPCKSSILADEFVGWRLVNYGGSAKAREWAIERVAA